MQTSRAGALASFRFNGTGFAIYGPIGIGGGPYTVSVNGTKVWQGTSQGPDEGGISKYNGRNLPLGLHEVVLQNTNEGKLQTLDWVG